jgi:hypothetical protein
MSANRFNAMHHRTAVKAAGIRADDPVMPGGEMSSIGQKGLKFRFLTKSLLRIVFKINILRSSGNRGFRIRMLASVASR